LLVNILTSINDDLAKINPHNQKENAAVKSFKSFQKEYDDLRINSANVVVLDVTELEKIKNGMLQD
jgi:hypothetical protein